MSQEIAVGGEKTPETENESAWSKLSKFKLSLSDLFFIVAFCAGLSLVCSKSWALPATTTLAISLSLLLGFFFVISGVGKLNPLFMLIWLFLSGVVLGCAGSIGVFWVAAAHGVGAIALCFVPRKYRTPRLLMRCSMVLIVIPLVYWANEKPYHLRRLLEARIEYPIEDISARLEFERQAGAPQTEVTLTAAVDSRLQAIEIANTQHMGYFSRSEQLKKIHGQKYDRFVRQLGFGIARMPGIGYRAKAPELPNVDFASAMVEEKNEQWRWVLHDGNEPVAVELGQVNDLSEFHFAGESDFFNANMIGYVAKPRPEDVHAAGFTPHAFHDGVEVEKAAEFDSLQLKKLELVSVLKFDTPRAYVLDHLPRMDELSEEDITTRKLSQFERKALEQLRSDEDVVIEQNGDVILMMGSLRAGSHCLDCHAGSRGQLLGAFSYEFSTSR